MQSLFQPPTLIHPQWDQNIFAAEFEFSSSPHLFLSMNEVVENISWNLKFEFDFKRVFSHVVPSL